MALSNFVPEIWARELNFSLKKELVGLSITNQDYRGEISEMGDTVHVTRPAAISAGSYTKNSDITIETPTSTQTDLLIDQATYFAFQVDDVDSIQANVGLMSPYLEEANYAVQDDIDQYILGLYTEADSSNVITKEALTAANIYGKLTEAKQLLSENSVPKSGRWVVLSPEEIKLLEDSDEFTAASDLGDDTKTTGFAGRIAGFEVFESNNLTEDNDGTDDVRHIPFGHRVATTFALQASQVEGQRMEKRFADLVKGLWLYGAKTLKPKALGELRNTVT